MAMAFTAGSCGVPYMHKNYPNEGRSDLIWLCLFMVLGEVGQSKISGLERAKGEIRSTIRRVGRLWQTEDKAQPTARPTNTDTDA